MTKENGSMDYRDTYGIRLVIAAIGAAVFIAMLILLKTGNAWMIDDTVGPFIQGFRSAVPNAVLKTLTHMGDAWFITTVGVILLLAGAYYKKGPGIPVAFAACVTDLAVYLLIKKTIMRPRPDMSTWIAFAKGYSFPSGHTMNSVFCYGMMIYLAIRYVENKKARTFLTVLLVLVIATVAVSRVYVGVHYPTDVIAAIGLGTAFLLPTTIAMDEYLFRRGQK